MVLLVAIVLLILGLLGFEERLDLVGGNHPIDEIAEHASRRRPGRLRLRVVAAVAQPNGYRVLGRDTAEPAVLLVVGGTGLAARLLAVAGLGGLTGAVVDNQLHAVDAGTRHLLREDALALGVAVVHDDVALAIFDFHDALGIVVHAAVGHRRVGIGHFERGDRGNAERQTGHRGHVGLNAHGLCRLDDLVDAHREQQADERGVRRQAEGALDGARPEVGAVVVVHRLAALEVDLVAGVHEHVGIDPLFQAGHEREQLEGRTSLAARTAFACSHVHLGLLVIVAAHERIDVAVFRIDDGHGHLEGIASLLFLFGRSLFRCLLHIDVKRGDDLQAALEQLGGGIGVLSIGIGQLVAHVAGEVGIGQNAGHGGLGGIELDRLLLHLGRLFGADNTVFRHAVEHEVAALQAVFGVVDGVVVGGRLRNAHERGRLVDGEVLRVLREVALGGGLDAIGARAVVDGVQVHEQDLVFGVLLLELLGDVHLANLALEGDVAHLVGQDGVAHELLGDGGRALERAAHEVVHERTGHTEVVNACMAVEALVLGGHRAFQHVLADLVEGNRFAVLQLKLGEQRRAVGGVDHGGLRGVVGVGVLIVGKIFQPRVAQAVHAECGSRDGQHNDRDNAENRRLLVFRSSAVAALHCT